MASVACRILFKGKDIQSSDHVIPTSLPKPNSGVMNVMTINTTSLEEHVASLTKTIESLTTSIKEKDEHDH